jgi:tRNA threonylcarbamoyladenosine biosynthesis protein TsaE
VQNSTVKFITLADAVATQHWGKSFGQFLPAGSVLLLVQGLAQGLGIRDEVVSPTFILVSEYPEGRIPLYHFDLYRLDTAAAITALGIEIYWEGIEIDPGIVAIEWSERLPYRPSQYWRLSFTQTNPPAGEGGRVLRWEAVGDKATALMGMMEEILGPPPGEMTAQFTS